MEFHSKLLQSMPEQKVRGWNGPLPFYMTYPGGCGMDRFDMGHFGRGLEQEAMLLKDLEYLQEMYPADVRRCQRRIAEVLDKADYEGSMIYDEYPDKYSLKFLADSIFTIMKREEENPPTEDMIQVLLFNEIYKRRHGGRRFFR